MTLISAGAIAGNGGSNTIQGTQGSDSINGNQGNDVLSGGAGNDQITGGTGADVLAGGAGNDVLYGGAGNQADRAGDTFVFDTALNASANVDTIYHFEANARDQIALDPTVFAALRGGATAGVDAGEFRASVGGDALDADDYLLYDTATGNLYYDEDGNGAVAKVLFASLVSVIGIVDYSDFNTSPPPGL
jgi:Ca2+-binding RTX toxin-like protein